MEGESKPILLAEPSCTSAIRALPNLSLPGESKIAGATRLMLPSYPGLSASQAIIPRSRRAKTKVTTTAVPILSHRLLPVKTSHHFPGTTILHATNFVNLFSKTRSDHIGCVARVGTHGFLRGQSSRTSTWYTVRQRPEIRVAEYRQKRSLQRLFGCPPTPFRENHHLRLSVGRKRYQPPIKLARATTVKGIYAQPRRETKRASSRRLCCG